MKKQRNLRNVIFLLPCILLIMTPVMSFSQSTKEDAKKHQRPKDSGIKEYDEFKNSSFNLLQELLKTDVNYETIKTDIAGYESGEREITIDNVKGDINRLKRLKKSTEVMDDRVKSLSAEGESLLKNAKDVKPVTKVKAATSNTKKSIQAVDYSKTMMTEITGQVVTDIETLSVKLEELGGEEE